MTIIDNACLRFHPGEVVSDDSVSLRFGIQTLDNNNLGKEKKKKKEVDPWELGRV